MPPECLVGSLPGDWPCHEFNNAETYFLVGDALARGMVKLLDGRGKP